MPFTVVDRMQLTVSGTRWFEIGRITTTANATDTYLSKLRKIDAIDWGPHGPTLQTDVSSAVVDPSTFVAPAGSRGHSTLTITGMGANANVKQFDIVLIGRM